MERVLVRQVILGIAAKQVCKQDGYDWIICEKGAKLLISEILCTKRATVEPRFNEVLDITNDTLL